ncbi:hypothetical protein RB653_003158 [Dictyostelium firmibasis]|uniref:Cyclin N-terminal domain-containing protein n=1 Tax=Dictyostelium firmibasis TaxID=79012 RepID=A0AAN7U408_9MYCE
MDSNLNKKRKSPTTITTTDTKTKKTNNNISDNNIKKNHILPSINHLEISIKDKSDKFLELPPLNPFPQEEDNYQPQEQEQTNNNNNNKNEEDKLIFNNNLSYTITPLNKIFKNPNNNNPLINKSWIFQRNPNFSVTNFFYPTINNSQPIDYSSYTYDSSKISNEINKTYIIVDENSVFDSTICATNNNNNNNTINTNSNNDSISTLNNNSISSLINNNNNSYNNNTNNTNNNNNINNNNNNNNNNNYNNTPSKLSSTKNRKPIESAIVDQRRKKILQTKKMLKLKILHYNRSKININNNENNYINKLQVIPIAKPQNESEIIGENDYENDENDEEISIFNNESLKNENEIIVEITKNPMKTIMKLNYQFEVNSIPQHLIDYYSNIITKQYSFQERKTFSSANSACAIYCRNDVIDFLDDLTSTIRMSKKTLQMTISIYDDYIDHLIDKCYPNQFMEVDIVQLVAISSLSIASKLEELEEFQPSIQELNFSTNNTYTHNEIVKMEMDILSALNFKVLYPTPSHFLDYLLLISIQPYDCSHTKEIDYLNFANQFKLINDQILKISYKDMQIRKQLPSIIACASIASTRTIMGIEPAWKPSLFKISNISMDEFYPLYSYFINEYNTKYEKSIKPELISNSQKLKNYQFLQI